MSDLTILLHLHETFPPPGGEERVEIGLQDKAGVVSPGRPAPGGGLHFACRVAAIATSNGLDFRGSHVQGRPSGRFLYLSWKRGVPAPTPWLQRVKIPLAAIDAGLIRAADAGTGTIEADLTGRKPHDLSPIVWTAPSR